MIEWAGAFGEGVAMLAAAEYSVKTDESLALWSPGLIDSLK